MRLDPPFDRSSRRAKQADGLAESGGGNVHPPRRGSAMTPERHEEIRRLVLAGAYNASGVIDGVARRLLASGDLSR